MTSQGTPSHEMSSHDFAPRDGHVTPSAVTIDDVGKRFKRHTDRRGSLKELIVRGRPKNEEDFWAVRDVSIDIPKGSVYGLIGHNGSGKSTLLKMIGGIYRPTTGSITTDGRVAALIELGLHDRPLGLIVRNRIFPRRHSLLPVARRWAGTRRGGHRRP